MCLRCLVVLGWFCVGNSALSVELPLKLMTYNVHGWRDVSHKCNLDRIVKVVQQIRPDILCLNEVLHPFTNPTKTHSNNSGDDTTFHRAVVEDYYRRVQDNQGRHYRVPSCMIPEGSSASCSWLNRLSDATHLDHVVFTPATDQSFFGLGVGFGNAILTKSSLWPILDSQHCYLTVRKGDQVLGSQPRDFVDPRSCTAITLGVPRSGGTKAVTSDPRNGHRIGVLLFHLDHKSEELREQQLLRGLQATTESLLHEVSHVVCGDLNTFQKSDHDDNNWQAILHLYSSRGWPPPHEQSLVLQALANSDGDNLSGYRDAFYLATQQQQQDDSKSTSRRVLPQSTAWTHQPLMRIDHILVKNYHQQQNHSDDRALPQIVPTKYYRVDTKASDHFPVVMEAVVRY